VTKLAEAFKELCAVCRVRPDLAAGGIEDAGRRLWRVLGEYPEAVALEALDQWPRQSDWFPTEKELRGLLDQLASAAAIEAAQRGEAPDGSYLYPVGRTLAFVERAKRLYGEDYCKSWLAGGITCIFTDDKIFTTGVGFERLHHDLGAAAREAGVEIFSSAAASAMLAQHCDTRGLKFEPKKGRAR
jgi:hypothetical protein